MPEVPGQNTFVARKRSTESFKAMQKRHAEIIKDIEVRRKVREERLKEIDKKAEERLQQYKQ